MSAGDGRVSIFWGFAGTVWMSRGWVHRLTFSIPTEYVFCGEQMWNRVKRLKTRVLGRKTISDASSLQMLGRRKPT
jgi:hypothetical protein